MIKELLQQAFILKTQGYYKNAIEYLYKALGIDNTSVELLLEIADCYFLMNDEGRALNYIEQILEVNPIHIESLQLLKRIFIKKNALFEAEQTCKNIYLISNNIEDLAEILKLLNQQKKYEEVINYETINNELIFYEKAYANLFLNNLQEAEKFINLAIDEKYNDKNLLLKCKILYKMDKKNECINLINKININTKNDDVLNFIGLVKQYECDFKKAIDYFLSAIQISPLKDEYYYNCASTYFKAGDIQNAKKYYNLAINIAPENQNYHFALANLYYSEKQYKRALEELNYYFFEAKLLKAIILYESRYLAIAQKEFQNLHEERPNDDLVNEYQKKIKNELKI
ncbi:tetratricopeptide repeat protein [bacterium]|nr:tetratricopeptide repeat protein [bacterium]